MVKKLLDTQSIICRRVRVGLKESDDGDVRGYVVQTVVVASIREVGEAVMLLIIGGIYEKAGVGRGVSEL